MNKLILVASLFLSLNSFGAEASNSCEGGEDKNCAPTSQAAGTVAFGHPKEACCVPIQSKSGFTMLRADTSTIARPNGGGNALPANDPVNLGNDASKVKK